MHLGNESLNKVLFTLIKMAVLKMIDWARLSFKKETLFDF